MNAASQWRSEIGERLGTLYASNRKVAAVILGGSAGRGHSDQFSDMDMGVFWHEAPTDAERLGVIKAAEADLKYLYDYDPSECVWCDDYFIGHDGYGKPGTGLPIEVVHYTADYMEKTLSIVLETFSTEELAHNLIAGVVNGTPLYGVSLLDSWKKRAATYPRDLSLAVVRNYAVIDHFWRWEMYLARGENLMLLYQSFAQVQQHVLYMLLGLNRVYYFGFKWLDVVADRLPLKPDDLLLRLRQAYQVPPDEGAQIVINLVKDTFTLIETHLPEIDMIRMREIFHYRRPFWPEAPRYSSGR